MTDLHEEVERAADQLQVDWGDGRARRVEQSMLRRRTRRAQVRGALAVACALLIVVFGGLTWQRLGGPRSTIAVAPPAHAGPTPLRFEDGSVAAPLGDASVVQSREVTASKIDVELVRGKAHFEVSKNPQRVFRVESGAVSVEVLGTGFTVERLEGSGGTRVNVEHGRVRVAWGDSQTILVDGQGDTFPPPAGSGAASEAPTTVASASAAPSTSAAPAPSIAAQPTWKSLAHDGAFDEAYAALSAAGSSAVHDEPAELLLAADVARLSHHPGEAVTHLRRVIDAHPTDPRAPLAAFTLGRVLLEELGQPAQAAAAFARARALGGGSSLAEDALAREVEAWWRAGLTDKARARAEEYLKLYPQGLRVRSVKKYGGLEE